MPANRAEQRHRRQASSHRAKNTKAQATDPNLTCGIHLWERRPRREADHQAPAKLAPGATLQQGTKHKAQAPHRFCGAGLPANRAEQRHRRQASSHRAKNTKAQATNPNPNLTCGIHLWERRPRREANHQAPAKLAPGATLQQGTKHKAQAPHRFCRSGLARE